MNIVSLVNQLLGIATLVANGIFFVLLISLSFKKYLLAKKILKVASENAVLYSLILALTATFGSLFYSEIARYNPCTLCWYQRIFMYPQTILFTLALRIKDKNIWVYGLSLSLVGLAIAMYHYLLQLSIVPSLPCSAVGYSASCSQRFVLQFGYITIPMMAVSAFGLISLLLLINKNIKFR